MLGLGLGLGFSNPVMAGGGVGGSSALKLFFANLEGSGSISTDSVTGQTVTTNGDDWTTAFAHKHGHDSDSDMVTLSDLGTKDLLICHAFDINNLSTFAQFSLREETSREGKFALGLGFGALVNFTGVDTEEDVLGFTGIESSGKYMLAASIKDSTTLKLYCGLSSASVVEDASRTLDKALGLPFFAHPDGVDIRWNSTFFPQATYGSALFAFSNGLPSDVPAALDWMLNQWIAGNKAIWPAWADLT